MIRVIPAKFSAYSANRNYRLPHGETREERLKNTRDDPGFHPSLVFEIAFFTNVWALKRTHLVIKDTHNDPRFQNIPTHSGY